MRVVIATKTWHKRNDLLPVWVDRMRTSASNAGWDITIIVCGSAGSKAPEGVFYIERENELHTKSNALMQVARGFNPDWYLYTGDDDLVCPEFCHRYNPWLQGDFDLVGWDDLYLHERGRLYYWPGYDKRSRDETIGAGRMLSRRVMEAIDWTHTPNHTSRGLDRALTQRIAKLAPWCREKRLVMADEGVMMIDVKDAHSVTELERFGLRACEIPMSSLAKEVLRGVG